jgi:hypothetical protein
VTGSANTANVGKTDITRSSGAMTKTPTKTMKADAAGAMKVLCVQEDYEEYHRNKMGKYKGD